jgi:hypothetical protein
VNAPFVVAAVVGHPISHSLSPAMHNDALRRRGVAGTYAAHDVTEESFASFLAQQRGTALRGLSVTMPLKDAAFDLVDNRDEFAQRSRSVNTITLELRAASWLLWIVPVRKRCSSSIARRNGQKRRQPVHPADGLLQQQTRRHVTSS